MNIDILLFNRPMADTQAQTPTQQPEGQQQKVQQDADARAKAKGKEIMVEQEDVDIMNLKTQDLGKPLDLKVYRKWVSKNIPDPTPTGICFMLLDKKVRMTAVFAHTHQLDIKII